MIIYDRTGKEIYNVPGDSLEHADLSGADLKYADLEYANLTGAIFREANLARAHLQNADLAGANLVGTDLRETYLTGANLSGAKLVVADLRRANLRGAVLRGAILRGVDLTDADLTDAYLSGANIEGANLTGANLHGVYIKADDAPGLRQALGIEHDPTLPARVLEQIVGQPETHDQRQWHSDCGTKHCVAGWFVVLAGPEGRALEARFGILVASTLLAGVPDVEMPSFSPHAPQEAIVESLNKMVAATGR